jgi:hypothetical protein
MCGITNEERIANLENALYHTLFAIGYLLGYSMSTAETDEKKQELKAQVLGRFPPALHDEIIELLKSSE